MKQTVFETRIKADELLREALDVWRLSDMDDALEGLENDPVMKILLTALAYQANETSGDIEAIKEEVLQDFAKMLVPYEVGHAVPATAVVEMAMENSLSEQMVDEKSVFMLANTTHSFIPLLKTHVLNAEIRSIVRMDGRRWKVSLEFATPITDISGMSFAVKNAYFQDLMVTLNGQTLPIVKPWDFSELPLTDYFGLDTILYNRSQTYNASALCLDLFARQNVRLFFLKKFDYNSAFSFETKHLDLVFEFSGITDHFMFDKNNFFINATVLVNAKKKTATLSKAMPVARVAGTENGIDQEGEQFLHAIRPSEEQLYMDALIEVRRVATDRFNQSRLLSLLNTLVTKYRSDFIAFKSLSEIANDKTMQALQSILSGLFSEIGKDKLNVVPGVYLMLRQQTRKSPKELSLDVDYLTTNGANVNALLKADSRFETPYGILAEKTHQIAEPILGIDEIKNQYVEESLTRYYLMTHDRIVTPADIKIFCYNELLIHYGINRDMVKAISVSRRQRQDLKSCGYEVIVEITLVNNPVIIRGFSDKMQQVAILIEKMIEVRSANVYPVFVTIKIED